MNAFHSKNVFEIVTSISWGEGMDKIRPHLLSVPSFGFVSQDQMRQSYSPLTIRLDSNNGIHILTSSNQDSEDDGYARIMHINPEGQFYW